MEKKPIPKWRKYAYALALSGSLLFIAMMYYGWAVCAGVVTHPSVYVIGQPQYRHEPNGDLVRISTGEVISPGVRSR